MMRFALILAFCLAPAAVPADEQDTNFDRLQGSGAVLFRNANGGTFVPDRLVVIGAESTLGAPLPGTPRHIRNEDRIDISEIPVLGKLFQSGLSPQDARAKGAFVGTLHRDGKTLVLDARTVETDLTAYPVTLTSWLKQVGAVSFDLGPLSYSDGRAAAEDEPIGAAFLVDGRLVLASEGGEPGAPSIEALFESLF